MTADQVYDDATLAQNAARPQTQDDRHDRRPDAPDPGVIEIENLLHLPGDSVPRS